MSKVRLGNYVYFDVDTQGEGVLPLLYCLRFAVDRGREIDFFLKGILTNKDGPGGGDPGWSIHWIPTAEEALFPEDWKKCMAYLSAGAQGCYEAWTEQSISDLDPPCAYYPKEVVRHHIHEVLENFRARHPERSSEVNAAIDRFDLKNA